jgi:DNA-binding MarR family transcriptional regulator
MPDRQAAVKIRPTLSSPSSSEAAFTRLVLLIFRLNGELMAAGDRMAAPFGQTSARWQVMGVVDHGPQTVSAVARTMGLRRQSVQRTADLLVADGAARYLDNPVDRRAKLLTLTGSGRRSLRSIERAQRKWARELGAAIGLKPLREAEEALEQAIALLEERSR